MKGLGLDNSDANPENFISMMQGMMTNLLSKDILYPSLKEIQIKVSNFLQRFVLIVSYLVTQTKSSRSYIP